MSSVYRSVAAWRHAIESVLSIGRGLADPQWAAPTDCPKWTVKDVYAHLAGGEWWMVEGHPPPAEGVGSWAEAHVLARREAAPAAVLADLRGAYERRRAELERGGIDPDQPTQLVDGRPARLELLLRARVLDVWVHEQDIRRAVGRPGNLASPGAAIAGDLFAASLPRIVARSAGAPPGAMVRLTTTGAVAVDVAVVVDSDGRGALVAPGRSAVTHITLGWEAYTRLSAGRGARADYEIRITGDRPLGERILAHLPITP